MDLFCPFAYEELNHGNFLGFLFLLFFKVVVIITKLLLKMNKALAFAQCMCMHVYEYT